MTALLRVAVLLVGLAGAGFAQDAAPEATPDGAVTEQDAAGAVAEAPLRSPAEALPQSAAPDPTEEPDWPSLSQRARTRLSDSNASDFALSQLRQDLVIWRDRFASESSTNSGRITTVQSQIAALGPAPAEGVSEAEEVAARRAELEESLADLRAPALLSAERYSEAEGMIAEIDALTRGRDASYLSARDPSPLNPVQWGGVLPEIGRSLSDLGQSLSYSLSNAAKRRAAIANSPLSLGMLALGIFMFWRARALVASLARRLVRYAPAHERLWEFLASVAQLICALVGLFLIATSVEALNLLEDHAAILVLLVVPVSFVVLTSRWIAGQYFAPGATPPIALGASQAAHARLLTLGLGWALALRVVIETVIVSNEMTATWVMLYPVDLTVCYLLWHLGRVLRQPAGAENEAATASVRHWGNLLSWLGQGVRIAAVIGALLETLGYTAAAVAVIYPAVGTLALVALLLMLQRLIHDGYAAITGHDDGNALIPVLAGFVLLLAAIPLLAVIWGMPPTQIAQIWSSFRNGFRIGDTQISPAVFLTFVLVFAIGYAITRLVQGSLKASVLPRTRLDKGGQNAISSGLGYIGVFLSAVIAITAAGIDLSSLAIVAGALSVGIGFGLQNVVSNFVSGIILLIERPISEGDWIEVGGQTGIVQAISVRSTRVQTFDRTDVIVPNADLVSGVVTNWTRGSAVGRIIVPVGVAYGSDTKQVEAILREVVEAHPMVLLNPPPSVLFSAFGASSLDFELRAILRDIGAGLTVSSDLHHEIARRFAEEGIEMPFPQQDLWLRNPETLRDEA